MKIPKYIEFHNETNCVLSRILKAAEPEEGCCILIGKRNRSVKDHKRNIWEVTHIWNCHNIWGEQESKLIDQKIITFSNQKNMQLSKKNRFEIDAKDQIASQKWARENALQVLCCAHSHPRGENKPSEIDLFLIHHACKSPSLLDMTIRPGVCCRNKSISEGLFSPEG